MCRAGKTHKHKNIITVHVLTKTATQETINCSIPEEIQVKKKKPGKLSSLIEFSASVKCWDETLQSIIQVF